MRGILSFGLALALGAASASAATPGKPYKVEHNWFGQPDLEGTWTNATLTPTTRQPKFGTRGTYTPEEVKELEATQQAGIEEGNKPIDNTKPLTDGVIAAHGGVGIAGNYDRGWFDPGTLVMRVRGEPRTSLLTTPNGQTPPRKADAAAAPARPGAPVGGAPRAVRAGPNDNPESLGLGNRCIISFGRNGGPPMFPNGFYNNNYQFVQSKDWVAINIEMVHDIRMVHLNGTHRADGIRPWFGDSIGHFDGDTLVVETTNIPQEQAYAGSWKELKVTERFTRVAKDRLLYAFEISDPTMWDKPWGGEYEFATSNGRVLEYACHEGNYALEGILAGARQEELMAKTKAAAK